MIPVGTILQVFDTINCGAALLDNLGSVIELNNCAKRILARQAKKYGCRISAEAGSASKVLRRLFGKELTASKSGIITTSETKSPIRPIVAYKFALSTRADLEPGALLVVVDLDDRPAPRISLLRQTFGLTQAEARLAARLAMGASLQAIAAEHSTSVDTARAQLKSVLAKTHTHRQAELVALVNRLSTLPE